MGNKAIFKFLSISLLILGAILLMGAELNITGAVIGASNFASAGSSILGMVFILVSVLIFFGEKNLEKRVEHELKWEKYPINKDSVIQDVEQEYLGSEQDYQKTEIQKIIERAVTGGKTISIPNKRQSYEEQFYEGHASQGGRVIEAKSHIAEKGEYKGRLLHFDQPANSRYLWVIDEDFNFILANRKNFLHDMKYMHKEKIDYTHRQHKLPHPTLAKGKKIYGSGEVVIEGGMIKEVNTYSGHYLPVTTTPGRIKSEYEKDTIDKFNNQGREVFKELSRKYGWKEVKTGAKYV